MRRLIQKTILNIFKKGSVFGQEDYQI